MKGFFVIEERIKVVERAIKNHMRQIQLVLPLLGPLLYRHLFSVNLASPATEMVHCCDPIEQTSAFSFSFVHFKCLELCHMQISMVHLNTSFTCNFLSTVSNLSEPKITFLIV